MGSSSDRPTVRGVARIRHLALLDAQGGRHSLEVEHARNRDDRDREPAAGVVGLGGATFPSSVKLALGRKSGIDTLIVNGGECEPYLSCDDRVMRDFAAAVIDGLYQRIIAGVVTIALVLGLVPTAGLAEEVSTSAVTETAEQTTVEQVSTSPKTTDDASSAADAGTTSEGPETSSETAVATQASDDSSSDSRTTTSNVSADSVAPVITSPAPAASEEKVSVSVSIVGVDALGVDEIWAKTTTISLDKGSTAVDLTDAIGGLPVSVVISGRDLIAASAVVTTNGDLGIEPAQVVDESVAANDLVAVVPGPGRLQLANPGDQESLIVIDWGEDQAEATTTASAGTVVSVPIPEGAETVRVTSTAPLSAALLLSAQGRSGFAIAQLEPAARTQASMPVEIDAGLGG